MGAADGCRRCAGADVGAVRQGRRAARPSRARAAGSDQPATGRGQAPAGCRRRRRCEGDGGDPCGDLRPRCQARRHRRAHRGRVQGVCGPVGAEAARRSPKCRACSATTRRSCSSSMCRSSAGCRKRAWCGPSPRRRRAGRASISAPRRWATASRRCAAGWITRCGKRPRARRDAARRSTLRRARRRSRRAAKTSGCRCCRSTWNGRTRFTRRCWVRWRT